MTLIEIFSILIIHWFADFVLQTDWQAKNKSSNNKALLAHTSIYTSCWIIFLPIVFFFVSEASYLPCLLMGTAFSFITFLCHTATDYVTSRINTRLYKEGKIHLFFVSIGFDQVLHYVQLFLTYYWLKP